MAIEVHRLAFPALASDLRHTDYLDVYKRQRMDTGHAGRVELPTPVETDNHLTPYLYGTDEELSLIHI